MVPPTEDELLEKAKRRYEAAERELARHMSESHGTTEEMEEVLGLLMDIYEGHPHALYSAGIDPASAGTMDSMMEEVSWKKERVGGMVVFITFFSHYPIVFLSGSQGCGCRQQPHEWWNGGQFLVAQ